MTTPVLPQVNTFAVSPYSPVVGSCVYRFMAQLINGQSGTLSITASIVP